MSSARVGVVEDEGEPREALSIVLRLAGVAVVATWPSREAALAELASARPDVVVVALGLPGIGGLETIRRLRARAPAMPILVLSRLSLPHTVVAAIDAGASGYLLKDTPCAELAAAIDQVRAGNSPVSPKVVVHILAALHARAPRAELDFHLTRRELEVLLMLVDGGTYPDIASALAIGLGTVQTHIKSIYRKLGVRTKAEAASLAVRHRLRGRLP